MQRALIMVDIQNDYFPGGKMELAGMDAAAENARRVLDVCRSKNQPVIHIQHIANHPGATFFLPDSQGADIHPLVSPQKGEPVIPKHFPNAFRETSLQRQLQHLGAEEIIVCGAMSHMCIDTTVRAAFDLGYATLLVAEACATRDLAFGDITVPAAQVHAAFMGALGGTFAQSVTVDALKSQLG